MANENRLHSVGELWSGTSTTDWRGHRIIQLLEIQHQPSSRLCLRLTCPRNFHTTVPIFRVQVIVSPASPADVAVILLFDV